MEAKVHKFKELESSFTEEAKAKRDLEAKVTVLEAELKAKSEAPGDAPTKEDIAVMQSRLEKEREAHAASLAAERKKYADLTEYTKLLQHRLQGKAGPDPGPSPAAVGK